MSEQDIIAKNRTVLYGIYRSKYHHIRDCLTESLLHDLRQIYSYILKNGVIRVDGKYTFFMDTNKVRTIIGVKTRSTANKHINYLCAMGMINKLKQTQKSMTEINKNFLASNPGKRPINNFYIKEYSEEELDRINTRCKALLEAKIKQGSLSYIRLIAVGLGDLANEIYMNGIEGYNNKVDNMQDILTVLDAIIADKGYATKQDIKDNLLIKDSMVDDVWSIFRKQRSDIYDYKRPDRKVKEKYGLSGYGWIITTKEK